MRTVIHHEDAGRLEIVVNGIVIAPADIAREVQNHSGGSARDAWAEATRALVVRQLLLQRGQTLGIVANPAVQDGLRETEEEALIRCLLEAEVTTPTADDAACRRYYHANLNRFRGPDLFEPLHILFKAAREDAAAYANALTRAQAALATVRAAPERFEEIARALSDCPSASEGGRLGQVVRGETTPEFEAAMLSLQPGQTAAAPVETRYGVHVLRLERKVDGQRLPFDQVRDRVAAYLEQSVWRRAVAQYVSLLAGDAQITGYAMQGACSPLVQ